MKNAKYIGIIAGFCLIGLIFAFGQIFSVAKIDVYYEKAPQTAKTEEIIQASGISIGNNIFTIDEKAASQGVEAFYSDNSVAVLNIERIFPNKVLLHVKERIPVFAIPVKDEAEKWVITDQNFVRSQIVLSRDSLFNTLIMVQGCQVSNTFNTPDIIKLNEIRIGFNELGIAEEALNAFIKSIVFEEGNAAIVLRNYEEAQLVIDISSNENIISNIKLKYNAFLALSVEDRFGAVL